MIGLVKHAPRGQVLKVHFELFACDVFSPDHHPHLALDDLEKDTPEINDRIDKAAAQKMISQGMDSFYQEASTEVKLDFAPVIEQLQRATQGLR